MVMQKKTRLYCDHDGIILCFYCVLLVNGLFFSPLSTDNITSQRKVEEQSLQVSTLVVVHGECILVDVCTTILSLLLLEWVYICTCT